MDSEPTLIANRNRASARFGSKRFISMLFPRSTTAAELAGNAAIVYPTDAFQHGICFEAKLIGVLDISRPQSRMEIVAAMRRVRYDHKSQGMGKRKVELKISVDGVKVSSANGASQRHNFGRVDYDKLDNLISFDADSSNTLLQHPIHRIFYVSHDSQDLNIFSYIVRESTQNDFLRCIVFKARRKAEAMQIVKTIGQAFDVCHQQQQQKDKAKLVTSSSENSPRRGEPTSLRLRHAEMPALLPSGHLTLPEELDLPAGLPSCSHAGSSSPNRIIKSLSECNPSLVSHGLPGSLTVGQISAKISSSVEAYEGSLRNVRSSLSQMSSISSIAEMRHSATNPSVSVVNARLEHELQKSRVAKSQIAFLKSQLASETAARMDSQNRIDELLRQNAMLLDVIENLLAPPADSPLTELLKNRNQQSNTSILGPLRSTVEVHQASSGFSVPMSDMPPSSSSSDGHINQNSSPDSGVKSSSSFRFHDEEMTY
ncbi:hypothetical protein RvY_14746 [Ramazzottius varieornatus]|uniref:PID domain-containing protein n=1 Tax=Ramazzottius varieornatus TaxID=947166 RepID=A0A1D1VU83_RAMVA|nr:hypothetical protein RvY_14746 [Ramazzottius varieornatus]